MPTVEIPELWGVVTAVVLALIGWLQSAARTAASLRHLQGSIKRLNLKAENAASRSDLRENIALVMAEIKETRLAIAEIDRRREFAGSEFHEFRERMAGELATLRARMKTHPRPDPPEPDPFGPGNLFAPSGHRLAARPGKTNATAPGEAVLKG